MLLLRVTPRDGSAAVVVPVFGTGLVGSAVARRLAVPGALHKTVRLDWDDPAAQTRQLREAEQQIASAVEIASLDPALSGSCPRLHFLWSAGRAGFSAAEEDVRREVDSFRRVLDLATSLASSLDSGCTSFTMISSAGGLFEGQRNVTSESRPAPVRSYGRSKLAQEELLSACASVMRCRASRLTSVFGYARPGRRTGLIETLVRNALTGRVTQVVGRLNTLRDFVWVGDVADKLAGRIIAADGGLEPWTVETLAAGKASSILEIKRLVESALGRKVYISYSSSQSNYEDITFHRSVLPEDWAPSDLQTNIRRVCFDALGMLRAAT